MTEKLVVDDALIDDLEHGPLHRFAQYATLTDVIPSSGAGVYTIRDTEGRLVHGDRWAQPNRQGSREPAAEPRKRPTKWRPVLRVRR